MQELVPIASGLLLGAMLGYVKPRVRVRVGVALAIVLGVLATLVTGEAAVGWEYVLIDIPLVAVCAAVGLAAGRRVSPAVGRG